MAVPVLRGQVEPVRNLRQRPALALSLIGALSLLLYALLALRYPLAPSLADPRASWIHLVTPSGGALAVHLGIYLALTLLYILALRLLTHVAVKMPATQSGKEAKAQSIFVVTGVADMLPDVALQRTPRRQTITIVAVWLACSCALLFMTPSGESHDIFDYAFRGRMMAELGANPLAEPPIDFRRAAFFSYLAWHSHVDTYGPLWEMASAGVATSVRTVLQMFGLWKPSELACPQAAAACHTLTGYLTGYRLLAIGLTGVSAWLLGSMVRRNRPELVNAALVAWLWSPLVLIASGVGAHNDAVMMPLLLAMLWLLQRQRWLLALLALILAAHVKLTALMLTPLIGLWIVRRCGWWRALGLALAASAIGLLLSWLLYAPFGGWGTLPRMLAERSVFLANSAWHALFHHLYVRAQWPYLLVWRLTVQTSTWLFVGAAVLLSLWLLDFRPRRWRQSPAPDWNDERVLWRAVTMISLLYLLVGAFWFQHWYVLWVAAPAALIVDSRFTRSLLPWLGFGALSANVASAYLLAVVPRGQPRTGVYSLIVAIIWAPIALAAIVGGLNRRWYADLRG